MAKFTYEQREWLKTNMLRKEMLLVEDLMINERIGICIDWDDHTEGVHAYDTYHDFPGTFTPEEAPAALLCEAARFYIEHHTELEFTTYAEAVKIVPEFTAQLPEQMQLHDRGYANPWYATESKDIEAHDTGDGTLEFRVVGWDRIRKSLAEAEEIRDAWNAHRASNALRIS